MYLDFKKLEDEGFEVDHHENGISIVPRGFNDDFFRGLSKMIHSYGDRRLNEGESEQLAEYALREIHKRIILNIAE